MAGHGELLTLDDMLLAMLLFIFLKLLVKY
jgi:hypothetical protein